MYRVKPPGWHNKRNGRVRRIGLMATMIRQAGRVHPRERTTASQSTRIPPATENYTDLAGKLKFGTYLWNSVFITVVPPSSRAAVQLDGGAFALSKYQFPGGRRVPADSVDADGAPAIVLVPNFLVISELGLLNSLWASSGRR